MTAAWQVVREPLSRTLLRNGSIALVVGAIVTRRWEHWPLASLLALWFSLGGHCLELWFLNWLRPRLSAARPTQVGARLAVWFVGGSGLALGMALTAATLGGLRLAHWPAWYVGGVAFVGLELVVHLLLHLRRQANFYDGRG